jgi:hypothetical protein
MNNTMLTQSTVYAVLRALAHDAGHDAASVRLTLDHCSSEIEFLITDGRGAIFSGSIPDGWRFFSVSDFTERLRLKYAEAFKPLAISGPATLAPPGEPELQIYLNDQDLLRLYRGADSDQTFCVGDGSTVRVTVRWSKK